MKNIKLYEEFILDEKINFKKIAAGAGILAILGMNIACSDKKFDKKVDEITNMIQSSPDSTKIDNFLEDLYNTDKELHNAIMKKLYGNDQVGENDRNSYKTANRSFRKMMRDIDADTKKLQHESDSLEKILNNRRYTELLKLKEKK